MGRGKRVWHDTVHSSEERKTMSKSDGTRRLISTIPPHAPTWAVYYWDGELHTLPVVAFAVWEDESFTRRVADVRPLTFSREGVSEETYFGTNFLGLSTTEAPKAEDWADEIESYRETRRNHAEKSQRHRAAGAIQAENSDEMQELRRECQRH